MAVSRPLLLALLGVLLAAATFVAARGASETAAGPATPAATQITPTPISPGPAKKDSPAKARAGKDAKAAPEPDAKAERKAQEGVSKRDSRDKVTPARRPKRAAALPAGVPAPVGRALRAKRVVVLFFGQGGADDAATAGAVNALRGLDRVSVFSDSIARLARYRAVVSGLGVAQAPAVVIVPRDRKAQVVEGFVDAGTLEQLVVDAR